MKNETFWDAHSGSFFDHIFLWRLNWKIVLQSLTFLHSLDRFHWFKQNQNGQTLVSHIKDLGFPPKTFREFWLSKKIENRSDFGYFGDIFNIGHFFCIVSSSLYELCTHFLTDSFSLETIIWFRLNSFLICFSAKESWKSSFMGWFEQAPKFPSV